MGHDYGIDLLIRHRRLIPAGILLSGGRRATYPAQIRMSVAAGIKRRRYIPRVSANKDNVSSLYSKRNNNVLTLTSNETILSLDYSLIPETRARLVNCLECVE